MISTCLSESSHLRNQCLRTLSMTAVLFPSAYSLGHRGEPLWWVPTWVFIAALFRSSARKIPFLPPPSTFSLFHKGSSHCLWSFAPSGLSISTSRSFTLSFTFRNSKTHKNSSSTGSGSFTRCLAIGVTMLLHFLVALAAAGLLGSAARLPDLSLVGVEDGVSASVVPGSPSVDCKCFLLYTVPFDYRRKSRC